MMMMVVRMTDSSDNDDSGWLLILANDGEAGRAPSGGLRSCACSRTGWGQHHHHHHDSGCDNDDDGGDYD